MFTAQSFLQFWRSVIAVPLAMGVAVFITEMAPPWLQRTFGIHHRIAGGDSKRHLWTVGNLRAGTAVESVCAALAGPVLRMDWIIRGPSLWNRNAGRRNHSGNHGDSDHFFYYARSHDCGPATAKGSGTCFGATRWEMIRTGVLRNARAGILGGVILGLGRALGETMAVTMVIGNRPEIAKSLFAPGYTMASVIANEFSEATGDLYLSSLVEVGLALFIVTIIVNVLAQILVWTVTRGNPARANA